MKKYIYKLTFIFLISGLLVSCEDELDQVPFDGFATDNAFITAQDFENGLRGVYSGLVEPGVYGSSDRGSMLSAPDVLADNVTLGRTGRNTKRYLHDFNYNASNTMLTLYRDTYVMIYHANLVLFYADAFEGDSKANVVAEAKALRALGHLNLASLFAKIPTQSGDANGSLGIAYVTEPDPTLLPSRLSVSETYAMIIQDLEDARAGINDDNSDTSNPAANRLNKNSVNLLLSRAYLYAGQWQNAIDAANAVTTSVAPRDQVVSVWEDDSQAGVLFYIVNQNPTLGNAIGIAWSQGGATAIIPEYVASFEITNLYASDDIRKEAYIFDASSGGIAYNGIKKIICKARWTGRCC